MIYSKLVNLFFIINKISKSNSNGKTSIPNILSILGISFGVMALIVVLSVMNGFQLGYINTIMEVTSGHIRIYGGKNTLKDISRNSNHKSFFLFTESQAILQGSKNQQQGCVIRCVEVSEFKKDIGLLNRISFIEGSFDLEQNQSIVLGYELAQNLGVRVGDIVQLPVLSGNSNTDMFPENIFLSVVGVIKTGYLAVDSAYAFTSLKTGEIVFSNTDKMTAFIKLNNYNNDAIYLSEMNSKFPNIKMESWRSYNHAFFGALRVEKNIMMLLIVLIFLVVSVNIYNGMRRAIYEKRDDIAVLNSLGMNKYMIQLLFVANGFSIGSIGSISGLFLGLLLSVNINEIFLIAEKCINIILSFLQALIFGDEVGMGISIFSPKYFYMETVPVVIKINEIFIIFLFGVLSSAFAAIFASRRILKLRPSEVLRYE